MLFKQIKKSELVEDILHKAELLFREILPTVPKELLTIDLTTTQLKVVLLLFLNGSLRMSTLAAGLGVTLATATTVMDRLVERDIVARHDDPSDRRVVLCSLTDNGQKMVSTMWQGVKSRTKDLLEALDLQKLQLLAEAIEAMRGVGEQKTK